MTKSELLKQFKKGEVKIHSLRGFDSITAKALICKGIAVHKAPWRDKGKWCLTHIQSGTQMNCGIGPWPKGYRWKALLLAWALTQEDDWTVCRSKILLRKQDYRAAIRRAQHHTLSESEE